jgi:DNA-binding HxlR family transcriptional regulator
MTEIPRSTDPFGKNRIDGESDEVTSNPNGYNVRECDTCGRKFAWNRFDMRMYRNCCESCSEIWDKSGNLRSNAVMKLYYYRVKVPRELKGMDIGDYHHVDFLRLELDILLRIRANGRPMHVYQLAEKLERSPKAIDKKCRMLVKKNLLRRVKTKPIGPGRPKIKYALTNRVVTLYKTCPKCGNNNYHVLDRENKIQCIGCKLKWVIPGVK